MATIEEIEARRAQRRADQEKARADQELSDLEAIDALEAEQTDPLYTMTSNGFRLGVPVKVAFRAPTALEYKRYCDMVGKAQAKNDPGARLKAQELLATACWAYPAPASDGRKAMLDAFPGVLVSMAIECAKVAEMRGEDEGKG